MAYNVFRLDNGKYAADQQVKRRDNVKKRFRRKGFLTSAEAKEWLSFEVYKFINFLDEPQAEFSRITFIELINKYLHYRRKLSSRTIASYKTRLNRASPIFECQVEKITPNQIAGVIDELIDMDYEENTINDTITIVKAVFTYGRDILELKNDPMKNIKKYVDYSKSKDVEITYYTIDEFRKFIKGFEDEEHSTKILYIILYYTGLRVGEAKALTWNHISFEKEKIFVNDSLHTKDNGVDYTITTTKGKRKRILTMPLPVINVLKEHYQKEKAKVGFKKDWFVLGGNEPLRDSTYTRHKDNSVDRYNENIKQEYEDNLKRITTHEFRHSFASLMVNNGVSLKELADLMGHQSQATTEKYYAQLYPETLSKAMKVLDNIGLE